MNLYSFWSFINFVEHAQTIMALTCVSLLLAAISLLILVICLIRLKFKLTAKELTPPKFPSTL
jgi:hypothetical protein